MVPPKNDSIFSTISNVYNPIHQNHTSEMMEMRCCQVQSKDSLTVLYDSRDNTHNNDITMVTFGTMSRADALIETQKRWKGPIVFILYEKDYNDLQAGETVRKIQE